MRTPTLYALILAGLLLPLAGAEDAEPQQTFVMKLAHPEQAAPPGAPAAFRLVLESRATTSVALSVHAADGVDASLSAGSLDLTPGSRAYAIVHVAAADAGSHAFAVVATSEDGETREARGMLHVKPHEAPAPAKPRPMPEPGERKEAPREAHAELERYERRLDAIERRLELLFARLEQGAWHREPLARSDRPLSTPPPGRVMPDGAPEVRATLADDKLDLTNEGRRVALLLEGGSRDARARLAAHAPAESGWRVELEREVVLVRAHERTFVWVGFAPGDAERVEYTIRAGSSVVHGAAGNAPARIA